MKSMLIKRLRAAKAAAALVAIITGLYGCAYKIPIKDNEPTATIRFVDPRNAAGGRSLSQTPTKITLLDERGCAELGHVAGIGAFNNYKMELTIPARKTLFFQWFSIAPALGGMYHCKLVKGFSPEASQLYEARFDMDTEKRVCSVDLVKISQRADGTAGVVRLPMSSNSPGACKGTASQ
jgi:hypothetical protein